MKPPRASRDSHAPNTRIADRGSALRNTARTPGSHGLLQRISAGVPARFMEPRLHFIVTVFALCVFGLLMVFSASSVTALKNNGNPAALFNRQLAFTCVGAVLAFAISRIDYHIYCKNLKIAAGLSIVLLLVTVAVGSSVKGAARWISLGVFRFQPSEFIKAAIILIAAELLYRFYVEKTMDTREAAIKATLGIVIPLGLIFIQPDKGTTIIIFVTLMCMAYYAGFPGRILGGFALVGLIFILIVALATDYSRSRFLAMLNPELDPYGISYQLLQGFYAFGNGGLTGVGIGLSHQKYFYLPEAHNDFIYAVIGEELGMVGTLGLLALYFLLILFALHIANHAPDLRGKFIVWGSATILAIQAFVNMLGIVGLIPMTGKALPFISYGGSSIMGTLVLVGLILSVSRQSVLPETEFDRRRSQLALAEAGPARGSAGASSRGEGVRVLRREDRGARSTSREDRVRRESRTGREGRESRTGRTVRTGREDRGVREKREIRASSLGSSARGKRGAKTTRRDNSGALHDKATTVTLRRR